MADYAWIDQNAYKDGEQYPHPVGQKLPNTWALYDMHGNVCEWCQDWYAGYNPKQKQAVDPTGPKKGRVRVWRGGNFARCRWQRANCQSVELRPRWLPPPISPPAFVWSEFSRLVSESLRSQ